MARKGRAKAPRRHLKLRRSVTSLSTFIQQGTHSELRLTRARRGRGRMFPGTIRPRAAESAWWPSRREKQSGRRPLSFAAVSSQLDSMPRISIATAFETYVSRVTPGGVASTGGRIVRRPRGHERSTSICRLRGSRKDMIPISLRSAWRWLRGWRSSQPADLGYK